MRRVRRFLQEARRRRLFRFAAMYIVAAWAVLQVCDLAFETWNVPEQALRYVWLGAILAFPFALVFGWRYDVTTSGIVRTPPASPGESFDGSLGPADYGTLVLLGFVAVAVVAGVGQGVMRERLEAPLPPPSVAEGSRAIAVLPFANLSEASDNEFFSDGLTEEVLNLLAGLAELKVASRSSSFQFKGANVSVREVAKRLGVDVVLEGGVRRQGDRVRVSAQLVDAANGFQLWSQIYDRQLEDIFEIQSDIARQVVRSLEIVLSASSRESLEKPYTSNLQAYEHYLLGRDYLRRPRIEENLASAAGQFQRAIELDPMFAQAYAGLCDTRLVQYEINRSREVFERAERACNRALTRDRTAAAAYAALGNLHRFAGQYEQSEAELTKALELNPRLVDAYLGLAETYAESSRTALADEMFRRAIDLDPSYGNAWQSLGNFLFRAGRYAEAAETYRKVIDRMPDNASAYSNLGAAYLMAGNFEGAAAAYEKSLQIRPSKGAYSNTGSMYYFAGDFVRAAELYSEAVRLTPDDGTMWGNLGDAYSQLPGREQDARDAYRRAAELVEQELRINPMDVEITSKLALYEAKLGNSSRARDLRSASLRGGNNDMYAQYYSALASLALGDTEIAISALERAVENGYPAQLLVADAGLSPLHGTERFKGLVGTADE